MTWTYYGDSRPDIRGLLNPLGASVLDLGCGEGALGAELKAAGAASVVGVELNPLAAEVAAKSLDLVVQGSIVDVSLPFDHEQFDYLIFGDVLEHVPDPDLVLARLLPLLRGGGHVIVSVPNWRFYSVLLRLAFDRWEYTESGVRDRTHLRVFTRRSLERFLARHDLLLEGLQRNARLIEDQSQIGRVGALLTRISNATLARWVFPDLLAYQYVAVARKI